MDHIKVSIVTPSYNQGNFLEQTIDSVLSQNYPNLEYIIIDGGSNDESVNIIKRYEKHLKYWISETDTGQSDAINKGLSHVTGEIFNWLNSDDYYEKDSLYKINDLFQNRDTKCVTGKSNLFDSKGIIRQSPGTDIYTNNLAKTIGWSRIDQPETFFRMNAVQKMGLLNQKLDYLMDREWWMRYLLLFGLESIKKTDDVLVNFRLHQDSKTVSESEGFLEESYQLWSEITELVSLHDVSKFFQSQTKRNEKTLHKSFYSNLENQDIITPAAHYAMLYLADYFYYKGDHSKSKKILSLIDLQYIQEDEKLFSKLKFRNSFPLLKSTMKYFRSN